MHAVDITPRQAEIGTRLLRAVDERDPQDFRKQLRGVSLGNQADSAFLGALFIRMSGQGRVDIMKELTDRFNGRGFNSTYYEVSLIVAAAKGKRASVDFLLSIDGDFNQLSRDPELLNVAAKQADQHSHSDIRDLLLKIKQDGDKKRAAYVKTLSADQKKTWGHLRIFDEREAQRNLDIALSFRE